MPYDAVLADRMRDLLAGRPEITEKKMFGGLAFLLNGHLAVGAGSGGELIVRAAPEDWTAWADGELVRPMEMRGRAMTGWLLVAADAVTADEGLAFWVDRGVAYAESLPPK